MKIRDAFWVFFISMVPLIELRGAIPVGTVLGLPYYLNYLLSVIGNIIPVPFILFLIPKILNFMSRFRIFRPIVEWVQKKAIKNNKKILAEVSSDKDTADGINAIVTDKNGMPITTEKKYMPRGAFLGLLMFVFLPIPGTGAWTASLVAALFDFPKLKSFIAISLGVLLCGIIMCLASYGVLGFLSFLL